MDDTNILVDTLINYILKTCPILLDCNDQMIDLFKNYLLLQSTKEILIQFVNDSQCILLQKKLDEFTTTSSNNNIDENIENEVEKENVSNYFYFDLNMKPQIGYGNGVVLLRRSGVLNIDQSFSSQFFICQVNDNAPLDTMLSYVRHCFLPASRALINSTSDNNVKTVSAKLSELEVELQRTQKNISIPSVKLDINPRVIKLCKLAKENNITPKIEDFGDIVNDATFLNSIQKDLNEWKKSILAVTKLDRDVASGDALQEVNFWIAMDAALVKIQSQLKSPEIELCFELLRQNKRFLATTGFHTESGLTAAKEKTTKYCSLLRDLPLPALLTSNNADSICSGVTDIFHHLKLLKRSEYPLNRALDLLQVIARGLANQIRTLLKSHRLMSLDLNSHLSLINSIDRVYEKWQIERERLREECRDLKAYRTFQVEFAAKYADLDSLKQRTDELKKLRREHDELRNVLVDTFSEDSPLRISCLREVDEANEYLKGIKGNSVIDIFDCSTSGCESWKENLQVYQDHILHVESELEERIRYLLSTADDPAAMFRVCAKFNALFVRPSIQSAIREYQDQLISTVKKGITSLEATFSARYSSSTVAVMTNLQDIPPVAGAIMWAKQLERQLDQYLQRVEDVLGKKWLHHVEGAKLKTSADLFRERLSSTKIFKNWLVDAQKLGDFEVEGRLFVLTLQADGTIGPGSELVVNFDRKLVTLFKEVKALERMGLKVPYELKISSNEAREIYPNATRLDELLRVYKQCSEKMVGKPFIAKLVANFSQKVQVHLMRGSTFRWHYEEKKLRAYVEKLSAALMEFQDKIDEVITKQIVIDQNFQALVICEPSPNVINGYISQIQDIVNYYESNGFSNVSYWVETLDSQLENILSQKLHQLLSTWLLYIEHPWSALESLFLEKKHVSYLNFKSKSSVQLLDSNSVVVSNLIHDDGPIRLELQLSSQQLRVEPTPAFVRMKLIAQIQSLINCVVNIPRLKSYWSEQVFIEKKISGLNMYGDSILLGLPKIELGENKTTLLLKCYSVVEDKCVLVNDYVENWLNYQSLWDLNLNSVYAELGDNISLWEQLLQDMRRARQTIDISTTQVELGFAHIDFSAVQSKVLEKYYSLQKEILAKFATKLSEIHSNLFSLLSTARTALETTPFEFITTSDIVVAVTLLTESNKKSKIWLQQIDGCLAGEKMLQQQRWRFDDNWLYAERLKADLQALEQILTRRLTSLNNELPSIQQKISLEDTQTEIKIKDLAIDWKASKPIQGDIPYSKALLLLGSFETKLILAEDSVTRIKQVKRALEIPMNVSNEERLQPLREELNGLKDVWLNLTAFWKEVEDLKDKRFVESKPSEIRKQLTSLTNNISLLPNTVRQYDAYEFLKNQLKLYGSVNPILVDLSSGLLRPKHQKQLLKELRLSGLWATVTIGQLWAADVKRFEKVIRAVLEAAQGESALEEFLQELSQVWDSTKFELADYKSRCFLVRNWDSLMSSLTTSMADLASMQQSPFFKAFEHEAQEWESKLNKAHVIYDSFIDVQRKWVYVEGVFNNSLDVQNQLAYQYNRFKTFDREFVKLTQSLKTSPQIDGWIGEDKHLAERLDRFAETLDSIQSALGEYLAKQRASFPRFYFVGDEDLLEIIGNGKDPIKINRHMGKMFAGIIALVADENKITAMQSKEGEIVPFTHQILIKPDTSVHEWLIQVENSMHMTLATLLESAVQSSISAFKSSDSFFRWVDSFPSQIVLLAIQVVWSEKLDSILSGSDSINKMNEFSNRIEDSIGLLAEKVLVDLTNERRRKYEQLITEYVRQRDSIRQLVEKNVVTCNDFAWLSLMRFYFNPSNPELLHRLQIKVSRATFFYGFEYLGVGERLVQTPLTDRAYVTLAEALHSRLGGNPFGPAGTGKTETVKALASQLGRLCLVFNCDESFDFQAMGRIFVGLCQCGAWGCFDEFNRLEERILSAVSQQIQTIQVGLKSNSKEIKLLGNTVKLNSSMGIFITMNPGYAGRSNLPDNLKQLFRGIAMIHPDRRLIAQVMLFSQGFKLAEDLSRKIVLLFQLCNDQLSNQFHYDFGLRALKSVLISSGSLKRSLIVKDGAINDSKELNVLDEQKLLIRSICSTVVAKLVADDIPLFETLLSGVFPNVERKEEPNNLLITEVKNVCSQKSYSTASRWTDKILQLHDIMNINHGIILVGESGSGKSTSWNTLLEAEERVSSIKIEKYVIEPKSLTKEQLFGFLDPTTLEWTDGVFSHIIRRIIDNVRGEQKKKHWIVFDGDVDPEWCENLNSVLDDNKLLTLPNGERLALTNNIRILFEVQDLRYATLATVSRCGMVWFSDQTLTPAMLNYYFLSMLKKTPITSLHGSSLPNYQSIQNMAVNSIAESFGLNTSLENLSDVNDCLVLASLKYASNLNHVMQFSSARSLESLFSMLKGGIFKLLEYAESHSEFPLTQNLVNEFLEKYLLFSICWSIGGTLSLKSRLEFCSYLTSLTSLALPPLNSDDSLLNYSVLIEGQWESWKNKVMNVEIDHHKITSPESVIETVDTIRHADVLQHWLNDHKPIILCGPPGSGKSMTLTSVLNSNTDFELVTLNFSSSTSPDLILNVFDHYCKYEKTPSGLVVRPIVKHKWLVLFCDEINLPANDSYGTQRVISFIRQLIEYGGFWQNCIFVTLERIQFVGACNPPTDAGRVVLSTRFLRHCPLLFVDFPANESLTQIYGTFNRALLKLTPALRTYSISLTEAMITAYFAFQSNFTSDQHSHYIYSPRELSRWVRGIYSALQSSSVIESITITDVMRLWLHEGLRLFSDRLVTDVERSWADQMFNDVVTQFFSNIDENKCISRPIMFTNWLEKNYVSVDRDTLRSHIRSKMHVFYEEEMEVKLVLFDEVIDHILRIDRVLRQPLGHLLLVGASGAGKTVLSRFVAWMNGMQVFQIKIHRKYTSKDFDKDLRSVLIRAGCKLEKICFIFDESNMVETAFIERMNALLASGEVPGLFEANEWKNVVVECKESFKREGLISGDIRDDEIYKIFCKQVQTNLHVVFTMNPSSPDFQNRSSTSPALFNRCVIDWFGDWSESALFQVALEFTKTIDIGEESKPDFHNSIVSSLVHIHTSVDKLMNSLHKRGSHSTNYITPRHYLDLIKQFVQLTNEKRSSLEELQRHMNSGLRKLNETQSDVKILQEELSTKSIELEKKNKQANEKLEQMVVDQKKAEQKRDQSEILAADISKREEFIATRRDQVNHDLSEVEPALIDAKNAVQNIKKEYLDELRGFANPPVLVKLALEALLLVLGEDAKDWNDIKKALRKPDFIPQILQFDASNCTDKIRQKVRKGYLDNPDFNFDTVNRASRAAGPMVKWVHSVTFFSEMVSKVEPLTNELKSLEKEANLLKSQQSELTSMIDELKASIGKYKEEYAVCISEAESIKREMSHVSNKVDRSVALLSNLNSERSRWEGESSNFVLQMSTIIGDCILSAAFLTYSGYFNVSNRQYLIENWMLKLDELEVTYKHDLSFIDYLSTPSDRLLWQSKSLPSDDLCTENAIMIHRFNRYPLVIDPSGQATEFLLQNFQDKKILRTSFLDDAFQKNLESALRFGNTLIVEDVDSVDSILNPILNKETQKMGGRILIRVGDKDIDFSPSFSLFMITRDPSCYFTPALCSRVTFVNFTITPGSLRIQCLTSVLKSERPDIDKKQSEFLKQQGSFKVQLRCLEDSLLNALSEVKTNILDDETILNTLEVLKRQSMEIVKKVSDSESAMKESLEIADSYRSFANSCSKIYFTLENLADCHFLYQFSLSFFLEILKSVLSDNSGFDHVKDRNERLKLLTKKLFVVVYQRVIRSLLQQDHVVFAFRLCQIFLEDSVDSEMDQNELDFLLKGKLNTSSIIKFNFNDFVSLTEHQKLVLKELFILPSFGQLSKHMSQNVDAWNDFIQNNHNLSIPSGWELSNNIPSKCYFHRLLVMKVLRPELFVAEVFSFSKMVLGDNTFEIAPLDLSYVIKNESTSSFPLLLISKPGYDASSKIESIAHAQNIFESFAMGSEEGFALADSAIVAAAKKGSWILLKNVHLSPAWLVSLEKKLHSISPHQSFRLFLTSEINPKIPVNLLRHCNTIIFEPPAGVKNSLLRTYQALSPARVNKAPAERSRLYFLISWLHAVILERLRYTPVGWSKLFEFAETDQQYAFDAMDEWIDSISQGKDHISPESIPWNAISCLLQDIVYGGRIDNDFDMQRLKSFVSALFQPRCFDHNFQLYSSNDGNNIILPDATSFESWKSWLESISSSSNPEWIGLPRSADNLLLAEKTRHICSNMVLLQDFEVEEISSGSTLNKIESQPHWMAALKTSIEIYLDILPKCLLKLVRNSELMKNPLFRCIEREVNICNALFSEVHSNLKDILAVVAGELKPNNDLRALMKNLNKDLIPTKWSSICKQKDTVLNWVHDFSRRFAQLKRVCDRNSADMFNFASSKFSLWLGGLFSPEAFVTGTRQVVSQLNGWPLEQMELNVTIETTESAALSIPDSFVFCNLTLHGSKWLNNSLCLSEESSTDIELIRFKWSLVDSLSSSFKIRNEIFLPVYRDQSRSEYLFDIKLPINENATNVSLIQRGVCITVWKP